MVVPTAANAVEMTPRMALKIPWKTARIDPSVAVIVWKMLAISDPIESTREGMVACRAGTLLV
jgi:hypothetical protein